jgi:hypothetical protein
MGDKVKNEARGWFGPGNDEVGHESGSGVDYAAECLIFAFSGLDAGL